MTNANRPPRILYRSRLHAAFRAIPGACREPVRYPHVFEPSGLQLCTSRRLASRRSTAFAASGAGESHSIPAGEAEKKGLACIQIGLTARHGDPVSSIVQVALPFDCYGQPLAPNDLPSFAAGAAQGIKQNFDVGDPQSVSYALGAHSVWAERAQGTLKGQPDKHYTIEIACALLSTAAVCWQTLAADPAALAAFEQGLVTLESDSPVPLVPTGTFKQ